jgi:hypothetical protein
MNNPQKSNLSTDGGIPPWTRGDLPQAPSFGRRQITALIGPGVVMVGVSIGAGEWLFGPAVTAQYGGTLLWLGGLSILMQLFYNLEVMRYALYCGEPVHVGFCRSWPGRRVWIPFYAILEFSSIWPFMASNAAVPLAAAMLGHLPGAGMTTWLGIDMSEAGLVKVLGYLIFILAFVPLIFGGTIYRLIERLMTAKMIIVLSFLTLTSLFMVSGRNVGEVFSGFFRVGTAPLRAGTVIADGHFTLTSQEGGAGYAIRGTMEKGRALVLSFAVDREGERQTFGIGDPVPPGLESRRMRMAGRARRLAQSKGFYVEVVDGAATLSAEGTIASDRTWQPTAFYVKRDGLVHSFDSLDELPPAFAARLRELVDRQGLELVSLFGYARKHGRLPYLEWAMLAGLAAIAGAGGLSNSLFSNYARDKGWGMGARVGAIPSAVGGLTISLSHVGEVFAISRESLTRWKAWIRQIRRDQAIWMVGSFLGMALPCMLSLEFIRNAPISGNRVGAMVADGFASRHPDYGYILWPLTLLISFLVLAPNQIHSGDNIARRWTDIIWTVSSRARRLGGNQVKLIYYGILVAYGIWGLFALSLFNPLQIAKVGTVLMNVALGASSLHVLYVNHSLLPPEVRPGWITKIGLFCCGLFFLGITVVVILKV